MDRATRGTADSCPGAGGLGWHDMTVISLYLFCGGLQTGSRLNGFQSRRARRGGLEAILCVGRNASVEVSRSCRIGRPDGFEVN